MGQARWRRHADRGRRYWRHRRDHRSRCWALPRRRPKYASGAPHHRSGSAAAGRSRLVATAGRGPRPDPAIRGRGPRGHGRCLEAGVRSSGKTYNELKLVLYTRSHQLGLSASPASPEPYRAPPLHLTNEYALGGGRTLVRRAVLEHAQLLRSIGSEKLRGLR